MNYHSILAIFSQLVFPSLPLFKNFQLVLIRFHRELSQNRGTPKTEKVKSSKGEKLNEKGENNRQQKRREGGRERARI